MGRVKHIIQNYIQLIGRRRPREEKGMMLGVREIETKLCPTSQTIEQFGKKNALILRTILNGSVSLVRR